MDDRFSTIGNLGWYIRRINHFWGCNYLFIGVCTLKYIIGIVGSRNTGKTTTTVNLTATFFESGFKVAIIKFMHHKFDLDPAHKDSAILRKTQAKAIISSSPYEIVLYQPTSEQANLHSLLKFISDEIDIVFCESYPSRFSPIPLIFACKDEKDYFETKKRFNYQKPLFITGIISNQDIDTLEDIPILSNTVSGHLHQGLEIILKLENAIF